ncbi:TRADD-N-associated membrane domain-containing protein [Priestia megaterium]|uniref:TRADD-N-associated membrane domain-containing protein n=1 Tax=Priestia megaterium TaxID=1404 RepID=UPI00207ACA1B|nr:hypothetical protein [Priestia megaterium]USL32934.1 hypothetical protein LIT30_12295 [Priestia megaterium]
MEEVKQSRKAVLEEREETFKMLLRKHKDLDRTILVSSILCLFIFPLGAYFLARNDIFGFSKALLGVIPLSILTGLIFFLMAVIRPQNELVTELQEIQNELDLLSISEASLEERSEKLFKHHHFELKRYYDENLKQNSLIFIVGIICIIIGFIIVSITMYFLLNDTSNKVTNKIIIASLGAVGALLSNFIAAIYLKMHSETVKSLTEFHNRFVKTHHFYFGNFLISKIEDQGKREDALAQLALNINSDPANNTPLTLSVNSAPSNETNKEKN